jgi:ABC-2 type transport system permease protein/oleandomycin transport system permease protein
LSTITAVRRPTQSQRVNWAISDGLVVTKRNLLHFKRIPTLLVFSIIQPIMFVLLFRYVFGNAICCLPPGVSYVNYLLPGIFVQTAIFGSTQTGIGLAEDMKTGLIDRWRSLPMARSAVLVGRTSADLVRNFVVVLLMIGVGYLVGFHFDNGLFAALAAIGLAVSIGFAFSWISATIGLAIRDVESVQAASFTWIFPLTFISSIFVVPATMPAALEAFSRNNPISIWANTVRVLTVGDAVMPPGDSLLSLVLKSAFWVTALLVVFVPLSIRMFRKLT